MKTVRTGVAFLIILGVVGWVISARATMEIKKAYEKVYETKVKCIDCHVDKLPKKEEGQHELNAYGKELLQQAGKDKVTEDIIKKVGTIEDFEKNTTK